MIARETPDLNIFAKPADGFVNDVSDLFVWVLDKSLFKQTSFGVEALYLALDNLIDDLFRLAGFQRLLTIDGPLLVELRRRHCLTAHIARIRGRLLHANIIAQL